MHHDEERLFKGIGDPPRLVEEHVEQLVDLGGDGQWAVDALADLDSMPTRAALVRGVGEQVLG